MSHFFRLVVTRKVKKSMDRELKALRKQLAQQEHQFGQRLQQLERRIDTLEAQQIFSEAGLPPQTALSELANTPLAAPGIAVMQAASDAPLAGLSARQQATLAKVEGSLSRTAEGSFYKDAEGSTATKQPLVDATASPRAAKKPSSNDAWKAEAAPAATPNFLSELLGALFAPLLGHFTQLLGRGLAFYEHYRSQGKAPVFFMTLTGVVALVLGFSYLLQYSFNEYLGATGKLVIGFMVAGATTFGGVRFSQKRKDMAEYGSSLIALGIILCYLCAYFAGPYYGVLGDLPGLLLLVAVTSLAYLLALLFETRVVAMVTLIGGASMPLMMPGLEQSPQLYLAYLLLLSCASLRLARQIRWPLLAWTSMLVSVGMLERYLPSSPQLLGDVAVFAALLHGFFYAFAHYALRDMRPGLSMTRTRLLIVSANLLFFLYAGQQLLSSSELLGGLYLLNSLVWLGLFLSPHKLFGYAPSGEASRTLQAIALLHAGLLTGVGILMLTSPAMSGVIWCMEGLVLIYLGSRFQFFSVRAEGYVALLLSIVWMGFEALSWIFSASVPAPELLALSPDSGWGNLLALTSLVFASVKLLARQGEQLQALELRIKAWLDNLLSLLVSVSFLLSVAIVWPQVMWLAAIVPMFWLMYLGQKKHSRFTELLGWGHYLLLLVPVLMSASLVGHFHFSEQLLSAQLARVEAFLCLWLIAEFYLRMGASSAQYPLAEKLRQLFFFLIPLFWLPSVLRQHSDLFPLALWASSAIALLLYYRLQYRILALELRLLVVAASVTAIGSCALAEFENWQGYASAALFAGLAFYLLSGWWGQGLRRRPTGSERRINCHQLLMPLCSIGLYYLGVALFIIGYGSTGDLGLSVLVTLLYFTAAFFYQPTLAPLRANLGLFYSLILSLYGLLTLLHVGALLGSSADTSSLMLGLYNVLGAVCAGLLVYRVCAANRALWSAGQQSQSAGRQLISLWLFHLTLIAVYVSLLAQLFDGMLGPVVSFALVVHATLLLFQTLKPSMKKLMGLSLLLYASAALKVLLWDMHDFSLVQKIIVFMLIGLCMLGAAFQFQKSMARNEQANELA